MASAPAKVILFGEHFVVYDAPAILAAIDRRTSASARLINDRSIIVRSDTGASAQYGESDFKAIQGGEKARMILDPIYHAVKNVIAANNPMDNIGLELELSSTVPIGIGLGSSAAACVASVASVDSLFGSHSRDWICERAVESERMIHRNSSGADCYISTFGGVIRYSKKDGYQKVEVKEKIRLVVCNTGIQHSTGDLVEGVRK
ncbi:MAG TPA: hypothetical protein VJP79_04225, partial [Nitrososphaera sp.]|nr:hypothetical protein [Nitrososphaera sp.]